MRRGSASSNIQIPNRRAQLKKVLNLTDGHLFMTGSMQLKTYEYVLHMNLRLFLLILQSAYWLCSRLELIFASAGPWGIRGGGVGESDFLFYTSVSRHCRIGFSILYLRLSPL